MTLSRMCIRSVGYAMSAVLLAIGLGAVAATALILVVAQDLPKLPQPLSRITDLPRTEIFAATGEQLMTLGGTDPVPLSQVSPYFINAIVATEDHRFWDHYGVDKLRTLKALYITLARPGRIQGASTITQQLAKNLFFSFEQSWQRKFREMLVAFQIEASSSKQEILHVYINQIHFGAGAQGIERAARIFFDKPASELDLGEAALLAGLPKSPTRYNPFRHYDRALARRAVVLRRMAAEGLIDSQELKEALESRPVLSTGRTGAKTGSYFIDALLADLVDKYGEEVVYHGGIKVTATLDSRLQANAETAVSSGLERLDGLMGLDAAARVRPQGALVAVETSTGAVKAMVGGRDYARTEFNRAVSSRRQPGSGFKPFVYYTALKTLGMHGATVMEDRPVSIRVAGSPDWSPDNFNNSWQGPMVLKNALTHSVNSVAAQLIELTGPAAVVETAAACGITSPLEPVYSLALGTSGVAPLEMASAFATFASGGVRHKPFLFWRIEDAQGRVIDETFVRGDQVLDPAVTYQVLDMMVSVIDSGSAASVKRSGFTRPAAGKTGTTDGYNDAWFTGFTPSLSVSVWAGFDRQQALRTRGGNGISGGMAAAPIWADFMTAALKNEPERDFPIPDGLRFVDADAVTGCAASFGSRNGVVRVPLRSGQTLCSIRSGGDR